MEQSIKPQKSKEKRIGNYSIGETIGEGTFGKVKVGRQITTGQQVAIKILQKEKIVDVADVERVSREIHILKLVHHPSIIQLYEIIQTPKHLFLVMEYLEGGQLFEHIVKNIKLQQEEACRYFRRVISAIAYLHQLNVAHRDLKPQNLLLDWKGGLKVVDFGLSNTYKQGQKLKTACGSPCYAAPEMISSKQYNGIEVDLWSSAVVVFAMVCGYLPFEDNNTNILYKKILSSSYILPKNVSPQFEDLLKNMLNIDPRKRLNIQQIHTHQWCQLAQEVPLHSGIIVGYHRIPVDQHILSLMEGLSFDIQYTERCIQTNKHNHSTATYYLLLKRQLKNGYKSTADIGSLEFDYQSIQPFKRAENLRALQNFFVGVRTQSSIQLQKPNLKITINQRSPPKKNLSLIFENRKARQFSHKAAQQQKKEKQAHRPSRLNDLRMYLNPSAAKKSLFLRIVQKQSRRKQVQSLHYERSDLDKQEQKPLRLTTEYKINTPAASIKSKVIKYRHKVATKSIHQKQV